jgi:cell division protein FtsZ
VCLELVLLVAAAEADLRQPLKERHALLVERLVIAGLTAARASKSAREETRAAAPERRSQEQVSEYARRPAGRPLPQESAARPAPRNRLEDDELEIPAFLRRQAN